MVDVKTFDKHSPLKSDWRNEILVTQKEKLRLLMTLWEAEKVQWQ